MPQDESEKLGYPTSTGDQDQSTSAAGSALGAQEDERQVVLPQQQGSPATCRAPDEPSVSRDFEDVEMYPNFLDDFADAAALPDSGEQEDKNLLEDDAGALWQYGDVSQAGALFPPYYLFEGLEYPPQQQQPQPRHHLPSSTPASDEGYGNIAAATGNPSSQSETAMEYVTNEGVSFTGWTPALPPLAEVTPSHQPVTLAQVQHIRDSSQEVEFVREYDPSLASYGITEPMFMSFLDPFHQSLRESPLPWAVNLAAILASWGPPPYDAYTAMTKAALAIASTTGHELATSMSRSLLDHANEGFFRPRGLFCMVVTYNPLPPMSLWEKLTTRRPAATQSDQPRPPFYPAEVTNPATIPDPRPGPSRPRNTPPAAGESAPVPFNRSSVSPTSPSAPGSSGGGSFRSLVTGGLVEPPSIRREGISRSSQVRPGPAASSAARGGGNNYDPVAWGGIGIRISNSVELPDDGVLLSSPAGPVRIRRNALYLVICREPVGEVIRSFT